MVLGDVAEKAVLKVMVTQDYVDAFAKLTGDYNPIHFGSNPIVQGMLTTAFVSTLTGTLLPGAGSVLISQLFNYLLPVHIDDTLKITGDVIQKSDAMKAWIMAITITNQNDDQVVVGKVTVRP